MVLTGRFRILHSVSKQYVFCFEIVFPSEAVRVVLYLSHIVEILPNCMSSVFHMCAASEEATP